MVISEMINANDRNKIISAKLFFLRYFSLIMMPTSIVLLIDEIVDYMYNRE